MTSRCKQCGRFTNWFDGDLCESCREKDEDEYNAEREDRGICPECGIPHGVNPYTGCGLKLGEKEK